MAQSATMTVDARQEAAPQGADRDPVAAGAKAPVAAGRREGYGMDGDDQARAMQERADAALDELDHRKAGARRTAWIIAAIAAAFFIASLFQGHFAHIPH